MSGAPLLKNTRLPVEAITGNYDAFREEGLWADEAIAETLDCYPQAGRKTIQAVLEYRAAHQFQAHRFQAHRHMSAINWPVVSLHVGRIAEALNAAQPNAVKMIDCGARVRSTR